MSWFTFHFACRYLSQKLAQGVELKTAKTSLMKNYHELVSDNALDTDIYKKIISINNQKKQQELFSIYGELNFQWRSSSINKLNNIRNYIFLLFSIFLMMSTICVSYVIPTFIELTAMMDVPSSMPLENFTTYWLFSIVLMTIISLGILRVNSLIQNLNISRIKTTKISQLLLSKNVLKQIQKIDALIYAPLGENLNHFSNNANEFVSNLINDNLNITQELQHIISFEHDKLTIAINARIRKLMLLLSFVVIAAIFNFVYSLYAPIFYIGNI